MVTLRAPVRPALGMSLLDAASLEAFSLAELQEVVGRLSARCAAMLGYVRNTCKTRHRLIRAGFR